MNNLYNFATDKKQFSVPVPDVNEFCNLAHKMNIKYYKTNQLCHG